MTTTIVLLAYLLTPIAAPAAQPQPGGLRIVVVEGEDAVNIIQQKTAVAPVIEVRDRNNLPVAGASVTFTLGGNTAAFAGGAQTLTVATNAAGQAVAAGLSPLTSGAVQIQVAAAFQGQAAAATIVQTNVLTAAQAAGAAGASASGASGAAGGAAGGGGGISGTTLGILGAAVGGGALAATQVGGEEAPAATGGGQGPRSYSGTFSMLVPLNFNGCTRQETWAGTLTITIASIEPLTGTAVIGGGQWRVEAVTCQAGPQRGDGGVFGMPRTPVTGTSANLGFTSEESNSFPPSQGGVGGINIQGFRFEGRLEGEAINGTLNHTRRIESAAGGPPGTGSASTPVTLR